MQPISEVKDGLQNRIKQAEDKIKAIEVSRILSTFLVKCFTLICALPLCISINPEVIGVFSIFRADRSIVIINQSRKYKLDLKFEENLKIEQRIIHSYLCIFSS